jgi:hypothetical protein
MRDACEIFTSFHGFNVCMLGFAAVMSYSGSAQRFNFTRSFREDENPRISFELRGKTASSSLGAGVKYIAAPVKYPEPDD